MTNPLFPFDAHYFSVAGGRMHYVDEGEGAPVVMLHGNPTWSFYYRELIHRLRGRFRVIAPDHIGCGRSDKPTDYPYTLQQHIENVSALLDHLGLEGVTLAVHDWGGAIGFGWATRNPSRVSRFLVFNTAAFLGGRVPLRIRVCGWPLLGELLVLRCNAFARAAIRLACCRKDRMTEEIAQGFLEPYGLWRHRIAQLCFVRDIPTKPSHVSYPVLQRIEEGLPQFRDRPMLICWGMKDFCFTSKFLKEWTARFPYAKVHRFEDAGHYVVQDAGDRLVPVIEDFLAETST